MDGKGQQNGIQKKIKFCKKKKMGKLETKSPVIKTEGIKVITGYSAGKAGG